MKEIDYYEVLCSEDILGFFYRFDFFAIGKYSISSEWLDMFIIGV
jgi:hypothetical protein